MILPPPRFSSPPLSTSWSHSARSGAALFGAAVLRAGVLGAALFGVPRAEAADPATGGADIELVRPVLSDGAMPGLDAARLVRAGALRLGAITQYERDILVLYQFQTELGAVVANRETLHLALNWQPVDRIALRASIPMATQWGSEVPTFGGDGEGAGDISVGTRFAVLDRRMFAVAGSADLYLPTGAERLWMGEESVRADLGALADLDFGPLGLRARLGTTLRPPVDTSYDLVVGSELSLSGGLNFTLLPDRLWLQSGLITRTSYSHFFEAGETVIEWLAGAEVGMPQGLALSLGVGRGLATGYGTSQARVLVGVIWRKTPPPVAPPPAKQTLKLTETPEDLTETEIAPPPPPRPIALAEVLQDQIVIRDPIQFEYATDHILPISAPTLRAIADVMNGKPEILHVVIEGHASEEGSFTYNYTLSLSRSVAIFAALVEAGVNPERISCRAMGEVKPLSESVEESALASNRRVEFHIVRRLEPGEAYPNYGPTMKVPWTGESRANPPAPAAPPPPRVAILPPQEQMPDFSEEEDEVVPAPVVLPAPLAPPAPVDAPAPVELPAPEPPDAGDGQ